ncbi:MAG: hypothetical protein RSB41_01755 [Bacilli bacterium]
MIKIEKKIPLLNDPLNIYTGGTCRSKKYIMLLPSMKEIVEYGLCGKESEVFNVSSSYNSVTINYDDCLLYMSSEENNDIIYRATFNYHELDSIKLKIPSEYKMHINSIFLNTCFNKILVCTNKKVYSVDLCGNFITSEISGSSIQSLLGGSKAEVYRSNGCCNALIKVENSNYFSCSGYYCNDKIVCYVKDNSAYAARISSNGNIISNDYIGDDIVINSILDVSGNLQFLVTRNKKYNYIYLTNLCCRNACECCNTECKCDSECYVCNSCDSCNECNECNCDADYMEIINCCNKKSKCFAGDIIESIALIETALSHILNAEGEKIQKIIEISDDPCELIKVNDSVNQVIKNITFLEHVLYNKLELAKELEGNCKNACEEEVIDCDEVVEECKEEDNESYEEIIKEV